MRCTNCSYPLWDIAARTCPECGEGFSPADYEFPPCGVRFCCPACDHAHEGTDARGQIELGEFACAGCKAPMSAAVAVVRLKPGESEPSVVCPDMPWLNRSRHGFWRAWWKTFKFSITSPRILMRCTPSESSWVQAVWYALVCILTASLLMSLLRGPLWIIAWSRDSLNLGDLLVVLAFSMARHLLWNAWWMVVMLLTHIATSHASLRLTGKAQGTMRRTTQALCYSMGLYLIVASSIEASMFAFDIISNYSGYSQVYIYLKVSIVISWAIFAMIMLVEAQRVSCLRALLAMLAMVAATWLLAEVEETIVWRYILNK